MLSCTVLQFCHLNSCNSQKLIEILTMNIQHVNRQTHDLQMQYIIDVCFYAVYHLLNQYFLLDLSPEAKVNHIRNNAFMYNSIDNY